MLKRIKGKTQSKTGGEFAIVASRYNDRYVCGMLGPARKALREAGASCEVVRVPGAYEIPLVASLLARRRWPKLSAILCLGVILRGETTHAEHVGEAVTEALMRIQVETGVPVIHEVLLLENIEQARRRCLDREYNRGREAALTALTMAKVVRSL